VHLVGCTIGIVSVLVLGFGLGIIRRQCDLREMAGLRVHVVDAFNLLPFYAA